MLVLGTFLPKNCTSFRAHRLVSHTHATHTTGTREADDLCRVLVHCDEKVAAHMHGVSPLGLGFHVVPERELGEALRLSAATAELACRAAHATVGTLHHGAERLMHIHRVCAGPK